MGKLKRSHNWKSRQQVETRVDTTEQKKIKLDLNEVQTDKYDETNALVLPSKKRKTKKINERQVAKKLTKKQRKHLEKIVEKKEKKLKRSSLLAALADVQASKAEMPMLISTAAMQSGTMKRMEKLSSKTSDQDGPVNAIAGKNKKRSGDQYKPGDVTMTHDESSSSSDQSESGSEDDDDDGEVNVDDTRDTEDVATAIMTENTDKSPGGSGECSGAMGIDKELASGNGKPEDDRSKELATLVEKDRKQAVYVPVTRTRDIQEARLKLPILGEEQQIMEAIHDHPVVVLCGETGSGKTTQVPQFLYEAGYASSGKKIAVTEPRRVAAISMSKRVATEMSLSSREVSYQIRYEGNVSDDTKIKFMTDGVLLKEIEKDFLLLSYSVVIIDEAHERSVFTDILLGLLSRIVPLRNKKGNPLKLVIMSATLRVEDFTENTRLFKTSPPVIKVDSRQFPVTIHFNKRTPLEDYLGEAFRKICKIHRMLPEGGILIFVTGQQEVHTLCKKLRRTFPSVLSNVKDSDDEGSQQGQFSKLPKVDLDSYSSAPYDEEAEMNDLINQSDGDGDMLEGSEGEEEEDLDDSSATRSSDSRLPLYVLPLYSLLASDKQAKVFEPPPEGSRLCVVATNVAETSLTIPNIKYVVDTGKVKTKFYDKVTGVSTFKVTWTSKASANQRAGRAGRTGPGHCYRLFSSAVYNDDFELFSLPEIQRRPVDDLVLQMKAMSIDKVINFPFPTPPASEAVLSAEQLLTSLEALEPTTDNRRLVGKKKNVACAKITTLGTLMSKFPVAPRFAKMLALGHQHNLLAYVVCIVAALSVQELFDDGPTDGSQDVDQQKQKKAKSQQIRRTWAGSGNSFLMGDIMVLLKAVGACEYAGCSLEFCRHYGLHYKAMVEVRKLRAQLTNTVNAVMADVNLCVDPKMKPPTDVQARLLRQIVLAGLGDHVARRVADPVVSAEDSEGKKAKRNAYQCTNLEDYVYVHPNSVLNKEKVSYIVYQDMVETSRLYMRSVMAIEPEWLPVYAASHCTFSKPLDDPLPFYDSEKGQVRCFMTSTFGRSAWQVPAVELDYPAGLDRYKWFAKFLLEGAVVSSLKQNVPLLLSPPNTMLKTWAKLQPRTEILLKSLVSEEVDSYKGLINTWKKNPSFLLHAYTQWLPQVKHAEIKEKWPPVNKRLLNS